MEILVINPIGNYRIGTNSEHVRHAIWSSSTPAHRTQARARGKILPRPVSFEPPGLRVSHRVFHEPNNLRTFPHLNSIKNK